MDKITPYTCPICGKIACKDVECHNCTRCRADRYPNSDCSSYPGIDNICDCSLNDYVNFIIQQQCEIERLEWLIKSMG